MRYTIRPGGSSISSSGFSVITYDPREALDHARRMIEDGTEDVSISDENGDRYDLKKLEQVAAESEESK